MIYFYSIYTKRAQPGMRKPPQNKLSVIHKEISSMINSCEASLIRCMTDAKFKIVAKFILLKLSLFL